MQVKDDASVSLLLATMPRAWALFRVAGHPSETPPELIFRDANAAFERLFGVRRGDLLGCPITQILPALAREQEGWVARFRHVALTGRSEGFEQQDHVTGARWRGGA